MSRTLPLLNATTGLNNRVDPARLAYDYKNGVSELAAAVNCDIDDTGRLVRRRGRSLLSSSSFHSLFDAGAYLLGVSGSALYTIILDLAGATVTATAIAVVTAGARVRYQAAADGRDQRVYWVNGFESGIVTNGANAAYAGGAYVGPPITRTINTTPPYGAHLITLYHGRMYLAVGNALYPSEHLGFAWFDYERATLFDSRLRMLRAVAGGVWVSTERRIVFLSGPTLTELSPRVMAGYPAVEGTDVLVDGETLGAGKFQGQQLLVTTSEGICLCGADGSFTPLTQERLVLPSARSGNAAVVDGKYIVNLDP